MILKSVNKLLQLFIGLLSFLNPLRKGFSRKEAVVYCSRRQGPTGLWEKLPELHYCLFNRGRGHLLKTDVEMQAEKINPSKKSVILITDEARASVGNVSLGELVEKLKSDVNVMAIYLHESPRNIQPRKDVVTVGPLNRGDLGGVVAEEIKSLQNFSDVECVLALSLECGEVLPNVWGLGLPILHCIPEFVAAPRQVERLIKSRRDATIQIFPSEEMKERACSLIGEDDGRHARVIKSDSSQECMSEVKRLASEAQHLLLEEKKECSEIKAAGFFDSRYAYPKIDVSGDRPIRDYLAAWRSGWKPRKPCPGFHPGIYRDHHPEMKIDPTIDFIRRGKPAGAWLTEVMRGEETEWLKVKSDCNREYIAVGMAWIDPATAGPQRGELSGRERVKGNREPIRAALHLHLHYTEGIEELLRKIKASALRPDLFISTTSEEGKVKVKVMLDKCGLHAQEIAVFPNRGRDIGPFLSGFAPRLFKNYEIVGHLHSKKSPHAHDDYLQNWVEFLEKGLIGEKGGVMDAILAKMTDDPSIGIIYPDDPGCFGWEGNYAYGSDLLKRMGFQSPDKDASMNFPVGTMFWARTAALQPLIDLNLKWEEYPEEPVAIDGSMLHAMERLIGIVPSLCGFRTVVTRVEGVSR
jgi:hypothetical protein